MKDDSFNNDLSRHIWMTKYRFTEGEYAIEHSIEDTWQRVAHALASVESNNKMWKQRFYDVLEGFKFLPGGRILAGAGTGHRVTLLNCFVMGTLDDSISSIFDGLREGAETMQQGGGVGYDFSTLRPRGSIAKSSNNVSSGPVSCKVFSIIPARELWNAIVKATYEYAEPGVLFIDRINAGNNLGYYEQICCTNPCGEVPLPPYGACDLGSINLTRFVKKPFSVDARLDLEGISSTVETAVRMLDNVISLSHFPLPQQLEQAHHSRRIGLGITGLADALIMLRMNYGSEKGRQTASEIMQTIRDRAYQASIELASIKGTFPSFDAIRYIQSSFIQALPDDLRREIEVQGIHNSHLLSIAPTGSISMLANIISGGMEPVFDFKYHRKVLNADGTYSNFQVTDHAYRLWKQLHPAAESNGLPAYFVRANDLSPEQHLSMQAALQKYVDQSISKTINVPEEASFNNFKTIYQRAYQLDLKGCTTFRPNPVTGSLLKHTDGEAQVHCCTVEREMD